MPTRSERLREFRSGSRFRPSPAEFGANLRLRTMIAVTEQFSIPNRLAIMGNDSILGNPFRQTRTTRGMDHIQRKKGF